MVFTHNDTEKFMLNYFHDRNYDVLDLMITNFSNKVKTKNNTSDMKMIYFKMIETCLLGMNGSCKLTNNQLN